MPKSSGRPVLLLLLMLLMHSHPGHSLRFWQVTDMHLDAFYSPAGDPNDYCHFHEDPASEQEQQRQLGQLGDFRCDAPWPLIKSAVQAMHQLEPEPDWIIWTGDSTAHWWDPGPPSLEYVWQAERSIVRLLRAHFPHTLILPVMGNHDSSPPDNFPEDSSKLYERFLHESNWTALIPTESGRRDFAHCGFYTHELDSGLVFLLLNTNLYYSTNNTDYDPCGQLAWLKEHLIGLRTHGQKAIVAAHVPPGYFERSPYGPTFNNVFGDSHVNDLYADLLSKYADRIVAQLYGHMHTDTFRLFGRSYGSEKLNPASSPTTSAFIAPSVVPLVNGEASVNPGVRLFELEEGADNLANYHQYYLDLDRANNMSDVEQARWEKLYDFNSVYNTSDLSLASVETVFKRMLDEEEDVFKKYYEYNTLMHKEGPCTGQCRRDQLCCVGYVTIGDIKACRNGSIDKNGSHVSNDAKNDNGPGRKDIDDNGAAHAKNSSHDEAKNDADADTVVVQVAGGFPGGGGGGRVGHAFTWVLLLVALTAAVAALTVVCMSLVYGGSGGGGGGTGSTARDYELM